MRLFIVASFLLVTVSAYSASLRSEKCNWGPAYWCRSLQTASTCQAFAHCLDTVWKRQLLDVQKTEVCLFSQKLVETVRRVQDFKTGSSQANHLVASMCSFIQNDTLRKECKNTVTNYLPEILKLMESDLEPSSVAHVLGFCEQRDEMENESPEQGPYSSPTKVSLCRDCHTFLSHLPVVINLPETEERFTSVMEDIICSDLGDLANLCRNIAKIGVPQLFKFLAENDVPEIVCGLSTFCTDNASGKPKWENVFSDLKAMLSGIFDDLELDEQETIPCNECNKVLTSVMAFKKDSYFRNAIERAVATLCYYTGLEEEECLLLSEGIVPKKLFKLALREMDVKDICTSRLSCYGPLTPTDAPRSKAESITPEYEVIKPSHSYCTDCVLFFANLSDALRNKVSVSEATAFVKQAFCQQVGSFEDQCNDVMDVTMPSVFSLLTREKSPSSVCSALTLCPRSSNQPKFDLVKIFNAVWDVRPLGDFKCDECVLLVQDLREADRTLNFQKIIEDFLNKICDLLGKENQQCKTLVQQYSPLLFEIIASELEPSPVCELLLRCTKPELDKELHSMASRRQQLVPKSKFIAMEPVQRSSVLQSNSVTHGNKKALTGKHKVSESVQCAICRLAMETLEQVLLDNKTEEAIEDGLHDLCSILPSSVKEPCDEFITTFTPSLLNLLLQELDPKLICDELKVCNETNSLTSFEASVATLPKPAGSYSESANPLCTICELVVHELDNILANNKSTAAIQNALDKVCSLFPETISSECQSFVNTYGPAVINLLLQELQPEVVCKELKLCSSEQTVSVAVDLPQKANQAAVQTVDDLECEICKIIFTEINKIIGDSRTEAAIIHAVQTVCDVLSGDLKLQCKSEVENYGPAVLDLLQHMDDPSEVCKAVKLCATTDPNTSEIERIPEDLSSGEICIICQTLAAYAGQALEQQPTQDEVENFLKDLCTVLPLNVTISCDALVQQFTPLILELLAEKDNPLKICQALKLCTEGQLTEQWEMLEMRACTFEPTILCATMDNARKCGMVEECVEKYGLKRSLTSV